MLDSCVEAELPSIIKHQLVEVQYLGCLSDQFLMLVY